MNIDDLKHRLNEVDVKVLQDFLLSLYVRYPEIADAIESLVLSNDPAAFTKAIKKRILSIKRGSKFIDYREGSSFARDLEAIVADIKSGLLEDSPENAFELAELFLDTAEPVLNRVDDSGGVVGEVYREAVLLWLQAAKRWDGGRVDWVDRVYRLYSKNDYGVFDPLLPNSHILLDKDQLTQLAWRYESDLRKTMKGSNEEDSLSWKALSARVALGMVAEAMKDPALYERSVLIGSPEPNDLQKKSIIDMYLKFGCADEALRWLRKSWDARFERDRLRLLDQAYEQKGDLESQKRVRRQLYQLSRSYESLEHYLEILTEDEKEAARSQAVSEAEKGDVIVSANLLLMLGETERAQSLVLARNDELGASYYGGLHDLAKCFDQDHCSLAATACYRALLLGILGEGRTKAYGHAARYYKILGIMANGISSYGPLVDHKDFIRQLEQDHGRKRSFWNLVTKQTPSFPRSR